MRRREFIRLLTGASVAGAPLTVFGEPSARNYRLATLNPGPSRNEKSWDVLILVRVLAAHGYALGKNLTFEGHGAMGQMSRLPQIVQQMKADHVDVIVSVGYPTTLAAKASGIPTVIAFGSGDPVATGLVESLAKPGGTVTGISEVATMLSTKRLSLLKQLLPNLRRVAMLWNRDDRSMSMRYDASAKAAREMGVTVQPLGVREPDDFDGAFTAMDKEPPDAIFMVTDTLTGLNRKRVFDYAAANRLPAIYEYDSHVREGGLMSYGPDLKECFERAGVMVARIFKGERPADLPLEQPTRYPFVINLKAAKAMNLEIPPMLIALADEVIE